MLFTVVLLSTLALGVLGTPIAMVKEAHAAQTAVAGMEKRADEESGSSIIWTIEKRADEETISPKIWTIEKRAPAAAKSKQLKRAKYPAPQHWRPDA